jgi:hypothetical protein
MDSMIETVGPETAPQKPGTDKYQNPELLIRIASWANLIAWLVLIFSTVQFGIRLYAAFFQGSFAFDMGNIYNLITLFRDFIIGGFYFVVLKAVQEVIYLLLDIDENTSTEESASAE